MRKIVSTIFVLLLTVTSLLAQPEQGGDFLRSIGKIYVVVGVLVTIFLGIVLFLAWLERRVSELEIHFKEE